MACKYFLEEAKNIYIMIYQDKKKMRVCGSICSNFLFCFVIKWVLADFY